MNIYKKYLYFDLLRIPISLSYKKRYLYRTFIGATLTLIFSILIIVFFIIKFNEIIRKTEFSIISNEYQNPKGEIDLSTNPILFALADNNGNPLQLNSKIFEFSVVSTEYVQNYDTDGNSQIINYEKEIEIERCDNLIGQIDFSYFSDYNLSYFTCIRPNQNISLNGTFGDITNGFKNIQINIKKCNNLLKNCYNNQYIESYIYNTKLIIVYLGYKTNFYNVKKQDIEQVIYSRSYSISPFFKKKIYYYMSLVKYELYDNLFLNNKKENIFFVNSDTVVEINPNIPINNNTVNDNIISYFSFVYDGNMIIYTKKMEKFIEIFSYISNFFNIMLTFLRIINNYFSNKILFIDIFYTFFFEDKFRKREKNVRFDNSHLFLLMNKEKNNSKINIKTQDKSINSNINLNSFIGDKNIIDNKNVVNNINKNVNNPNIYNKTGLKRILTNKSKIIEKEKIVFKRDSKLYFLCPLWLIKTKKNLSHLIYIKESICNAFSVENFIEFIKIKKLLNNLSKGEISSLFEQRKNHFSDKNIRASIKDIINNK